MDTSMIQGYHTQPPFFFSTALAFSKYLQSQTQQMLAQINIQLPDDLDLLGLQEQDKKNLLATLEEYNKVVARSCVESASCKRFFMIDRFQALKDTSLGFQLVSSTPSPSSSSPPPSGLHPPLVLPPPPGFSPALAPTLLTSLSTPSFDHPGCMRPLPCT
ncbi:hypothetical protein PILCRDRAFT_10668 [Piloderma croceum F 1598]|uniref:Uncharacterized protein n=1 Tax=Piloderma croceum (strain F 1598) TaxID=765440 RepID=A0A0C3AYC0_PILCF|nr:hypothetical protein PILCRDRAFT_10668 [Piloderma croceum F 1598]